MTDRRIKAAPSDEDSFGEYVPQKQKKMKKKRMFVRLFSWGNNSMKMKRKWNRKGDDTSATTSSSSSVTSSVRTPIKTNILIEPNYVDSDQKEKIDWSLDKWSEVSSYYDNRSFDYSLTNDYEIEETKQESLGKVFCGVNDTTFEISLKLRHEGGEESRYEKKDQFRYHSTQQHYPNRPGRKSVASHDEYLDNLCFAPKQTLVGKEKGSDWGKAFSDLALF
jgi:hypothetical protein